MPSRFPLVMLSVFIVFSAAAQESWVVGSYTEKARAVAEGERISGETGLEVLLQTVDDESPTYRLLVQPFSDEQDQQRLRTQLQYAGVADILVTDIAVDQRGIESLFAVMQFDDLDMETPELETAAQWTLTDDRNESADFLVAGSFSDRARANAMLAKLSESFDVVTVREMDIKGTTYHRVLFGPVRNNKEDLLLKAAALGLDSPWVLRDVAFSNPQQATQMRTEAVPALVSGQDAAGSLTPAPVARRPEVAQKMPEYVGDYNPAKLRKGPSTFVRKR